MEDMTALENWWSRRAQPWLDSLSLETEIADNEIRRWLFALGALLLAVLVLSIVNAFVRRRIQSIADRTNADWARGTAAILQATKFWFLVGLSLYLGSLVLTRTDKAQDIVQAIAVTALVLQGAIWGNVLITFLIADYMRERLETDAASVTTMTAVGFLGKLALWSVAILLILANVGVDVTALIAGLGIGGAAIALASQNILGDLFASLSIVLDKPFVLGDFIVTGDMSGNVEHIGLKTTRVRSLSGEQLIFPNGDLLQSRIRNFKRMQQRRVVFSLGVTYETPRDLLAAIPGLLQESVEAQETVRFDRAHFQKYGDFALIFEVVYFVLSSNYNQYMDIQQQVNFAILDRFQQRGIEFAYPTQTLYVQRSEPVEGERGPERFE